MMGRGKSEIPAFANIFSCNFFPRKRSGFFFGMMERFMILFRVLCLSCLSVVYVFLRVFAYVLRCCLRFCFLPFARIAKSSALRCNTVSYHIVCVCLRVLLCSPISLIVGVVVVVVAVLVALV